MRQRKVKNEVEKLIAYRRYIDINSDVGMLEGTHNGKAGVLEGPFNDKTGIDARTSNDKILIDNPTMFKGKWSHAFQNSAPIYIEVGCGKGQFITTLARNNPDKNYIGIEGQGSVILRALERASRLNLPNLIFIHAFVNDFSLYFAQNELAGIYLNFSDPWPKYAHEKRRLTYRKYIFDYLNILCPNGTIEIKTDNKGMFQFTLKEIESLREAKENQAKKEGKNIPFQIIESTENLHCSKFSAKDITTEYEDKFIKEGKQIYYMKFQVGQNPRKLSTL